MITNSGSPAGPTSLRKRASGIWTSWPFRVLVVLAVVALSVAIYLFRDKFQQLAVVGYPGIFVVCLLGNATIVLPAPYLLLVFALGTDLSPPLVALAAASGSALGELTGYAAGFGGRAVVEKRERYARLTEWMRKRGDITVLVLSFVPNPFVDVAGIIAGTLRYPLRRFLLFCWIGKLLKMLVVAYAGAESLSLIQRWLH